MKRSILVGGALLVVLLAGAAFVGGQLLGQSAPASGSAGTGPPRKIVTPAAGLPAQTFDAGGDVTRLGDNNIIFICDPHNALVIKADGSVTQQSECKPEIEVVIGHDTQIIHDVTARQYQGTPVAGKDIVLSQAIEPGVQADIGTGTAIRVWGDRRGDRITARTLLYWTRASR